MFAFFVVVITFYACVTDVFFVVISQFIYKHRQNELGSLKSNQKTYY